ncbi:MAG: hypothetical protein ACE5GJ_03415 [Gemmatimonadota bacterium]
MKKAGRGKAFRSRSTGKSIFFLLAVLGFGACKAPEPQIPNPRPIVIHSGARIRADKERLKAINEWVMREQKNITEDPSFWVIDQLATDAVYPWEGMRISNDTVWVKVDPRAPDSRLPHQIYGHLHLMAKMGRQAEWLPEAPDAKGYELERAILSRVADAWLLGRTVFDTAPYGPLDELMFAKDAGYLDAFIFTARPNEFTEERREWARAHPDGAERYRQWFLETFNREPPGLRTS